MPKHYEFLSLEVRGWAQLLERQPHKIPPPPKFTRAVRLVHQAASYHGTTLENKRHSFSQECLLKQSACLASWFYRHVVMELIWTPEFNDFNEWVNTYGNIEYMLCMKSSLSAVWLAQLVLPASKWPLTYLCSILLFKSVTFLMQRVIC